MSKTEGKKKERKKENNINCKYNIKKGNYILSQMALF